MKNLSDHQKKTLLKNQNVEKITDKNVFYTSTFKIKSVEKYLKGTSPKEIFIAAGIDPNLFVHRYCQSSLKRWKKKFHDEGKDSLKTSQTGKKSTGRPRREHPDELTIEELRALVEIQRETIDMLKKNRALAKKKKVE